MSFFNNAPFGLERKILIFNPFNTDFRESGLIPPPPGQDFMVTEVVHDFMKSETTTDLMIVEA